MLVNKIKAKDLPNVEIEKDNKQTSTVINKSKKSKKIIIICIICFTVAVISVVGGLIYMQQQDIAQKNREFEQKKQLVEYEQTQLNNRNQKDNSTARCINDSNPSVFCYMNR
jgi:flagellar basal body-associated protein FliL